MNRMRVGLTGLGLVFLATLAASVAFAPDSMEPRKDAGEPLAQLGVAPSPDKEKSAQAKAPPAVMDSPRELVIAPPPPGHDAATPDPAIAVPVQPALPTEDLAVPDAALSASERSGQRPRST